MCRAVILLSLVSPVRHLFTSTPDSRQALTAGTLPNVAAQKYGTVNMPFFPNDGAAKRAQLRAFAVDVIDVLVAHSVPFVPWSGDVDFAVQFDEAEILFSRDFRYALYLTGYILAKSSNNVWKIYSLHDYCGNAQASHVSFERLPEYLYCTKRTRVPCKAGHVDLFAYKNTAEQLSAGSSAACASRGCWYNEWKTGYEGWFRKSGNPKGMHSGCPSKQISEQSRIPADWIMNTSSFFVPKFNRNVSMPVNTVDILTAIFGKSWRKPSSAKGHHFVTQCSECGASFVLKKISLPDGSNSYQCVASL